MKLLKEIVIYTYNYDRIPLNFVRIFSTLRTGLEKIKMIHCYQDNEGYCYHPPQRTQLHFNIEWVSS